MNNEMLSYIKLYINDYKLQNNNDYVTGIRFDVSMLQVVIPGNQKLIDLSKMIKVNQKVKL